jgi:hypothetical protein
MLRLSIGQINYTRHRRPGRVVLLCHGLLSELFVVPRGVEHCPSSTTPSPSRSRYEEEQRVVFGRNTYQTFAQMLGADADEAGYDLRVTRMRSLSATVVSTTLTHPSIGRTPRSRMVMSSRSSPGSRRSPRCRCARPAACRWNRALMVAGLVDRIQLTVFAVITGQTGDDPIFLGAADFDLELIDSRTLAENIQELVYRPTLHA